ncbi:MAG: hypothetical protein VW338_14430 [Rhodospirillaceae bacterium]
MPSGWRETADRPELLASLEYIQVHTPHLGECRSVMRDYCGPAAAKLVESKRIGTFRAMETAAVLYRNPKFDIDWNQLHLCEVNANGFKGFGQAFTMALREVSPEKSEEIARVFAGLDRILTLPRWTFNDPFVEERRALTRANLDCA